jgi:hypothetical protein
LFTLLVQHGGTASCAAQPELPPLDSNPSSQIATTVGQLDKPITSRRNDEVGVLVRSLERLRKSMRAAMARLR